MSAESRPPVDNWMRHPETGLTPPQNRPLSHEQAHVDHTDAPNQNRAQWRDRGSRIAQLEGELAQARAEVASKETLLRTMDHFADVAETCERKANESHARREAAEAREVSLRKAMGALADRWSAKLPLKRTTEAQRQRAMVLAELRAAIAAEPTPAASGIVTPTGITPGGMSVCPECQRWGSNPAGLCTNAFHEPTLAAAPHAEDGALVDVARIDLTRNNGTASHEAPSIRRPAPVADPSGNEGGQ